MSAADRVAEFTKVVIVFGGFGKTEQSFERFHFQFGNRVERESIQLCLMQQVHIDDDRPFAAADRSTRSIL